jgi:hemerythrin superfamily protein
LKATLPGIGPAGELLVNIFHLIENDHRYSEELLSRIGQPPEVARMDHTGRLDLVQRLIAHASSHEAAEEVTLWPKVKRSVPDGESLVAEALAAERDLRAELDLLRYTRSETDLIDEAIRLHGLIRAHIGFEEEVVFPQLRRRSTRIWSAGAGLRFRMARRLGPTRPHPHGPDQPAGLLTAGVASALVDHLRDHGRPKAIPSVEPGAVADGLELIRRDHDRIRSLCRRTEEEADPDPNLVKELLRQLSVHDSVERQYLYPALRDRIQDGQEVYSTLISEHAATAALASRLERYRFRDAARRSWLHDLTRRVGAHMDREESAVLPALAAHMSDEELIDLGDTLASARAKAPTRAHPKLAGAGPAARWSRRIIGPVDGVRDAVSRRRHE